MLQDAASPAQQSALQPPLAVASPVTGAQLVASKGAHQQRQHGPKQTQSPRWAGSAMQPGAWYAQRQGAPNSVPAQPVHATQQQGNQRGQAPATAERPSASGLSGQQSPAPAPCSSRPGEPSHRSSQAHVTVQVCLAQATCLVRLLWPCVCWMPACHGLRETVRLQTAEATGCQSSRCGSQLGCCVPFS